MPGDRGTQAITDSTVQERTGRSWQEWHRVLDRAGAKDWTHKATATWLRDEEGLSGWWAQAVTVRYEQDRKGRVVGTAGDGTFQLGVTRTFDADPAKAYRVFRDAKKRTQWLVASAEEAGKPGTRLKKLAEADWVVSVEEKDRRVRFHIDGAEKTKVILELRATEEDGKTRFGLHMERVPSERSRDDYKAAWRVAMDRLRTMLTQG